MCVCVCVCVWRRGRGVDCVYLHSFFNVYEVGVYYNSVGTLCYWRTALKLTALWAFFCNKRGLDCLFHQFSEELRIYIRCSVISLFDLPSAKNPRFASHRECYSPENRVVFQFRCLAKTDFKDFAVENLRSWNQGEDQGERNCGSCWRHTSCGRYFGV